MQKSKRVKISKIFGKGKNNFLICPLKHLFCNDKLSFFQVIWLLTYDDEVSSLAEAVEKYHVGIPPVHWLPWIPQLLTCLVRHEGRLVLNLLSTVGRMFPQAVYFPIRTLYLTLKIEQRERHKTAAPAPEVRLPQQDEIQK
jgi:hypothetical protein